MIAGIVRQSVHTIGGRLVATEKSSGSNRTKAVLGGLVLLVAIAVVAALVVVLVQRKDSEAGAAGAVDTKALDKFYSQKIDWGPCAGFEAGGSKISYGLQCARVTVPVDYDDPDGDTAQIAISRSRATGEKTGSILLNPGGPGASGLRLGGLGIGTELGEHFDVVGFDPRGIGASTPTVKCETGPELDADRASNDDLDNSPAGIEKQEADTRKDVDKCVERTGKDFLAHVGTHEVVRDMDVIRGVLGDEKLTYLGISYGTFLGSTYAETFPDKVRAMVLDGAVNPNQDARESKLKQTAGFQKAFDDYAAACAKQPACPLGADPAGANAAFRALVDPLVEQPAATKDPRGLSFSDAHTGVVQALYSQESWQDLTDGLRELSEGRGDKLLEFADTYLDRRKDGTYSSQNDANTAVQCVDKQPVTDRAQIGQLDTDIRKAAPFLDDGRGTGLGSLGACAMWPVQPTSKPHEIKAPGLPKVVVVSTTDDPATPYQAGVDLAKQLGATLVTYEGTQHGATFSGIKCVDDAIYAYLEDLKLPEEGLTCAPEQ